MTVGERPADRQPAKVETQARPSSRRWLKALIGPLIVLAAFIGIWYFISYVVLDPERRFLLPPLHVVVDTAFGNGANLVVLMNALLTTTIVAVVGLAIAALFGIFFAVVMSESVHLEGSFYPYLVILQTIPILALVPLIGFWLGFGFTARVIVCVLIALFPIAANTLFGLQSTTQGQKDLFRLHRASRTTRLVKLKLPMALPAMIAGFRISAGLSVVGEIVGGFFFQRGTPDLGVLLDEFTARLNGPMLFGAIIISSLLGVAMFGVFTLIGSLTIGRWKE